MDNLEIFGTGFLPSEPDERDYGLSILGILSENQDDDDFLVKYLPNIYNQGSVGQCVAFSLAKIKEAQEMKERGVSIRFSNSYIYANRADRDYQGEGMYPRQALKRLSKYGTVEHKDFDLLANYPTVKNKLGEKITQLLPLGLPQRINTYARLKTNEDIMSFLKAENTPALYCVQLFENFRPVNGIIPLPQGNSRGGHAMIVCGWKTIDNKKHWIVSNSWSENWGENGYCYIPFEYPLMEAWGVTDRSPIKEVEKKQKIQFVIGSNKMYTDMGIVEMDTPAIIRDGRTMISARFLAEALGCEINYQEINNKKIVTITNGGIVDKL
jgi:hypothetical protein